MPTGRIPLCLVIAVLACAAASVAKADLTPRWTITPINPGDLSAEPALQHAYHADLLVNLSGASLFNVAGLVLDQTDLPGVQFYHVPGPAGHQPPHHFAPNTVPNSRTNVFTTEIDRHPAVPGTYFGDGPPQLGQNGVVNVAWGATPNTGPLGGTDRLIARITFLNVDLSAGTMLRPIRGEARSSDDPNTPIPLPPIPLPAGFIPEPGLGAVTLASLVAFRRRGR